MRYRDTYIEKQKTLAQSGTEIIDITVKQPITELYIELRATNAAIGGPKDSPLARCISKIELVDGSKVLYSLTGQQAMANCCFDMGRFPCRIIQATNSDPMSDTLPIRFGRKFGDVEYAFLPTNFNNPQLKITWDLDANGAVTAGERDGTSGKLTVIARVMEDAAAPKGFLMTKEVFNFTTAGSGDERIDLPTDHSYRRLMIRSFAPVSSPEDHLKNLKLSMDQDAYVPFDMSGGDVMQMMDNHYGKFRLSQHLKGVDNEIFELWTVNSHNGDASVCGGYSGNIFTANYFWNGAINVGMIKYDGTPSPDYYFHVTADGICPEHTFAFPFGDQNDPADWLKAPDYGSIRLFLTQQKAAGAASVFIQQEKLYTAG